MKNVKEEEIRMNEIKAMQSVNPLTVSADELVDINDVKVSKDLPKQERIAEFI